MIITFISDSHNKHLGLTADWLKSGDVLVHTGDISSMGYEREIRKFLKWFQSINTYDHKIFIAGNHDMMFEDRPEKAREILADYPGVIYLEDSFTTIHGIKIYGSPWQPQFYNWAFNLPRNGLELAEKWNLIPDDTDILLTHGPPYQILDKTDASALEHLGCEVMIDRVLEVNPIIHAFGHIHGGYGLKEFHNTAFINCSNLNERYEMVNRPIRVNLDTVTKQIIEFL